MKLVISKKSLKSLAKKGEPKATTRKAPSKKITTKKQTAKAKTTSKAVKAKSVKTKKAEAKTARSSASLVQTMRSFLGLPTCDAAALEVGSQIRCRLTSAHTEGLSVALEDGSKGLVRATSIGKTVPEREKCIAGLVKGQELVCSVVSIDGSSGRVTLDLVKGATEAGDSLKPDFMVLDGSNLIGGLADDSQRSVAFPAFADAVIDRGSWPIIFYRSTMLAWLKKAAPVVHSKIEKWCAENPDKCVRIDAASSDDQELLQFLADHPNAVGISRDRFADFRDRYAHVMGRVFPFTSILSIPGVRPTVRIPRLGISFDVGDTVPANAQIIELSSDRGTFLMMSGIGPELTSKLEGGFIHSIQRFRGVYFDCYTWASIQDLGVDEKSLPVKVEKMELDDYLREQRSGLASA